MSDAKPSESVWTLPPKAIAVPSRRVGRYELCFELASGGMASVFLARTDAIGGFRKLVALKVIHPHLSRNEEFVSMFLDEARLVAQLHHPNVATVIDVGQDDDTYFMAMEHVLGESGSSVMRELSRRPEGLPDELPLMAAKIVADACEGLHAAHELRGPAGEPLGVVHRDVSPGNVLVGFDGGVRVIDFGVAKAAGRLTHTRSGVLKGKFAYMSPEQLAGGTIDRRSDVWALGVVLWEMTTGRRLFRGAHEGETVLAVQTQEVTAPSRVRPDVPRELDPICLRALARDPDARYATAREMARDLRRAITEITGGDPPGLEEVAEFMERACGPLRLERIALVESARRREAGVEPATSAPAHVEPGTSAAPARASNVLPDPSSFVGREREAAALLDLVAAGERLVSIVGPPGIGKTRLAHHCAEARVGRGEGSVWLVDLGEARTEEDVCAAVLSAQNVRPLGADAVDQEIDHVGRTLARHEGAWLVLDNFEHLADLAPRTVERWAKIAQTAVFIVTSRERLRIAGEKVLELAPLTVSGEDDSTADAVRLLIDRASGYTPAEGDLAVLAQIARALDGIPLALELAATRLAMLGPRQLLARMPDHLDLLSRGRRGATERHATLRAAIEWSWSLLSAWERSALAQCSVFHGGFDVDAAERVVDLAEEPAAPPVFDVLAALRDKSLLRARPVAGLAGETRLELYAAVRDFASAQLTAMRGEARASERHAARYAEVGERWASEVRGLKGAEALLRLETDRDNLLSAAAFALATSDPSVHPVGARLVLALDPLLGRLGPFERHLALLDRAIEVQRALSAEVAAELLLARARALRHRGRMEESAADLDAVMGLFEELPGRLAALVELERAEQDQAQGRIEEARAHLDRALDEATEARDQSALARIHRSIGLVHHSRGRLDDAWESYVRAHELFRAQGDRTAEATVLHYFGSLRLQQGRLDEARAHYERALSLERQTGDARVIGSILGNLAILEQEVGRRAPARERYVEALRCVREVGDRTLEGHLLGYFAGLAFEDGELEEAARIYEEAVELLRAIGDKRLEGLFLAASGAVAAALGRERGAAEAFERAEELLEEVGDRGLLGALALHRAHLHVRRWRDLRERDPAGAGGELARAQAVAREADGELRSASDDYRFAHRVLRDALAEGAIVVHDDAAFVTLPSGERIDLSTRLALRRIVARLLEARLAEPGVAVSIEALVAAGWPDEKMLATAAQNRVNVALTSLRKLGLRGLLLREGDGYLLDPAVPVA